MLGPTVAYMRLHLRQMARLSITPYKWEPGSPYPTRVKVKPKKRWKDYRVNLAINMVYAGVMTGNYLCTMSGLTLTQQILAGVFMFMSICPLIFRLNYFWKEEELVQLLVSFLQFEESNHPVYANNAQFLTELVVKFITGSVPGLVLLEGALLYSRPCMAPALEYILLGGGGTCWKLALWWRLPLILFDAYIWLMILSAAALYAFQVCFVLMRCLDVYLRNVKRLLEGNSAQDYRRGIVQYRQIQLLEGIFNDAFQAVFFPIMMFGVWICFVLGLYGCVKLHDKIDMPEFAFFPLMLLDIIVAGFVVKVAANVIDQCEKCLEVAKNNKKFGRKLLFKRMIRSMGKVRVRFGSTNFVDQLTPFNMLNHALDTCVNLMLLS